MYFSQYVNRSCLRAAISCKSIVEFTEAFKGHQPERETLGDETRKERKKKTPHTTSIGGRPPTQEPGHGFEELPLRFSVLENSFQSSGGGHFALELSPHACSLGFFSISLCQPASPYCDNMSESVTIRRESGFGFIVLDISVHGQLCSC